jgi:hypothetical protein
MGAHCTASEQAIRNTLKRIADRFSASQPAVDYGFIFQRLENGVNGCNWSAAATASVPWKADGLDEYQAALDAICVRVPYIE